MKACLLVLLGILLASASFAEDEPSYSDRNDLDADLPDVIDGGDDEVLCCAGFALLLTLLLAAGWARISGKGSG